MKAILVLDEIPGNCLECPIGKNISIPLETCIQCPIGKCVIDEETEIRPDWCPLNPMPEKKETGKTKDILEIFCNIGYNACIDEILGDKE